jgi:hypothetical protein
MPYSLVQAILNVRSWEEAFGDESDAPLDADDDDAKVVGGTRVSQQSGVGDQGVLVSVATVVEGASAVPLPPQDPPPLPPPEQDVPRRGRAAGNPRSNHPHYQYANGYIVWREKSKYLDVHCSKCGKKHDRKSTASTSQSRNFRAQGRPLGWFLLWLEFDCGGSGQQHDDLLKLWKVSPGFMFEERKRARLGAKLMPHVSTLWQAERDPWPEEVPFGEPLYLAGLN